MSSTKPFKISKPMVMEAYRRVRSNKGSAGIDGESIEKFEKELKNNLYKIWNRMSSGAYFPPAVKQVEIPKASGGKRKLGIPTVSDRVAQMVVKMSLEPKLEPIFHDSSFGYRPKKSAIQAVEQARENCFKYAWVLEFDIKGMFDNIDHELLMKAVRHHTTDQWIILYIERWLKAPFKTQDGNLIERTSGTPQGGVVSPLLANLFMHYCFDKWMDKLFPTLPFERFADDGVIHCKTEEQAKHVMVCLTKRLEECGLEIHPDKSKIVYCKNVKRKLNYPNTKFVFLGYEFRRRLCKAKHGGVFVGFVPAVSPQARRQLMDKLRSLKISRRTIYTFRDVQRLMNPIVRGWTNYFGKFCKSAMDKTLRDVNLIIIKWAMRKFKRFRCRKRQARKWLMKILKDNPKLFSHWKFSSSM